MYNNCVQNKTRDANHIHALLTAAYTLLSADIHKIPAACEEPANADLCYNKIGPSTKRQYIPEYMIL